MVCLLIVPASRAIVQLLLGAIVALLLGAIVTLLLGTIVGTLLGYSYVWLPSSIIWDEPLSHMYLYMVLSVMVPWMAPPV